LLYDRHFTQRIMTQGSDFLPPNRLVLELAEWAAVRNFELVSGQLEQVRRLGARLAIDDMGTGYSNLRHLTSLRPDFLKLDISLIRDIHKDPARRAIIAGLMGFCQNTGAVLVAEGVEQVGERDALLDLGVPLAQGFWFARPAREFWRPPR
jgi:EAL domain-containing protein (putative c-di-GMP-specific phosphodiesterase class I)